jgi:NitT/TauT family transport system permease protein
VTATDLPPDPPDTRAAGRGLAGAGTGSTLSVPRESPVAGRSLLIRFGPPLAVFVGFIIVWYLYARFVLDENGRKTALPYPHDVVSSFFGGADGSQPGQLLSALWLTFLVSLIGLVIAILLGVTFAVLMSQAKWVETSFYPYAILLQTVPILALVPLIGLLFGFGFSARILVCVIIALFPIITNTLFGLKSAEKSQHELFTLHGAGKWTRLVKLQLPASLPAMFTGFQISAGLSVIGAIVGGFFFGRGPKDLGNRILLYSSRLRPGELIAAVILSALLGIVFFQFFGWARNRLTSSWYQGR